MTYNCPFDNTSFETLEELCSHIRKFKIKQEDFFIEFYPRKDLLTGELIKFRNVDQYLSSDFNNKNNLKKWLKLNTEEGKKWAINWLKERTEKKKLAFAPDQVYLRSLTCPTVLYYNNIGNYNEICQSIGLKVKYDYNKKLIFNKLPFDINIICDTREQHPFELSYKAIITKLNCGDYGLEDKYDKKIYVERKSLADMISSLTSKKKKEGSKAKNGLERIKAELQRAKDSNSYIIMVVEDDLNSALSFEYLPQCKWTKVTSSHIFKNIRDLLIEFDNFQIVFAGSRKQAELLTIKIFELGVDVKNIDLQYYIEKGELI